MKTLDCIIFNVEHGFSTFIKSPNDYCLLIDFGRRELFSPVKWIRKHYNAGNNNIKYYKKRRFAEAIVTHLHLDHFDDVGSLVNEDKPKILTRDKETLKLLDKKIKDEKDSSRKDKFEKFKKFSEDYTDDVKSPVDWGFDFFDTKNISYKDANDCSSSDYKLINNRSYLIGISFAGKKILIPGDIEKEGWEKAFSYSKIKKILKDVNFFVASHHGHKSGITSEVLKYTGKPDLYLISVASLDAHVSSFYSNSENSNGFLVKGDKSKSHSVTTRDRKGSIRILIKEDSTTTVEIFEADDNLTKHQKGLLDKRSKKVMRSWKNG
jgi:beta-lactamase superfamily II metal-dependent hydrolase